MNNTQSKKRKRSCDTSFKCEPEAKKVRGKKSSTLEKDRSPETCSSKSKVARSYAGKNLSKQGDQSYLKSDWEVNNNIPVENFIPTVNVKASSLVPSFAHISSKITSSENFKKLRDLSVLLDRTVADNYLRQKLLTGKQNPPKILKRRSRSTKFSTNTDAAGNRGQKTLFDFYDVNSSQHPPIGVTMMMPAMLIKRECSVFEKVNDRRIEEIQAKRVRVSVKELLRIFNLEMDLEKLISAEDVKVDSEKLISPEDIKTEPESLSSENNNNVIDTYCSPEDWIKMEPLDEVSIDENLANIKIENVSPNLTDENSMETDVSESWKVSWNENDQVSFDPSKVQGMSKVKLTDTLSALSQDHVLAFYDQCLDASTEVPTVKREIAKSVSNNFTNSISSSNSSKLSWHISEESGIFTSDESTNFN